MQRVVISLVHRDRLLTERALAPGANVRIGSARRSDIVLPVAEVGALGFDIRAASDGSAEVALMAPPPGASGSVGYSLAFGRHGHRLSEEGATAAGMLSPDGLILRLRGQDRVVIGLGGYRLMVHLRHEAASPALQLPSLRRRGPRAILDADPVWWLSLTFVVTLVTLLLTQALVHNARIGRFLTVTPSEIVEPNEPHYIAVAPAPTPEPEPAPLRVPPLGPETPPTTPEHAPKQPPSRAAPAPAVVNSLRDARHRSDMRLQRDTIAGAFRGAHGASTSLFDPTDTAGAELVANFGRASSQDASSLEPGGVGLQLRGAVVDGGDVHKLHRDKPRQLARADLGHQPRAREEVRVQPSLLPTGPSGPDGAPKLHLARLAPKVRRCYEQALRGAPTLAGKLELRVVLGQTGRFDEVTVLGFGPPLADCVESAMLRVRGLPVVERPVSLRMAFVLTPG